MFRSMLKSKIHRATVTDADLNYEGSITIDRVLMEAARIFPFEQVSVYNISNGERFKTYVIPGQRESGIIGINGAAARKASTGDKIIIASYVMASEEEIQNGNTSLVFVDQQNKIVSQKDVKWLG